MRTLILGLVACCLLLISNESKSADPEPSEAQLANALAELRFYDMNMTADHSAYLHAMPKTDDCRSPYSLVVPVLLKGYPSTWMSSVSVTKIWVRAAGVSWSTLVRKDDLSRNMDSTISVIARGCPDQSFVPGTPVVVVLRLTADRYVGFIRAPGKPLALDN
jgi:hypothetical protein